MTCAGSAAPAQPLSRIPSLAKDSSSSLKPIATVPTDTASAARGSASLTDEPKATAAPAVGIACKGIKAEAGGSNGSSSGVAGDSSIIADSTGNQGRKMGGASRRISDQGTAAAEVTAAGAGVGGAPSVCKEGAAAAGGSSTNGGLTLRGSDDDIGVADDQVVDVKGKEQQQQKGRDGGRESVEVQGGDVHHAKAVKVGGHVTLAAAKANGGSSIGSGRWPGVKPNEGEVKDGGKSEGAAPGRVLAGGGGGGSSVRDRIAAMQKNMQK